MKLKHILMCVFISVMVLIGSAHATAQAAAPADHVVYQDLSLEDKLTFTALNLPERWQPPSQPKPETIPERRERLRLIVRALMLELPEAKGLRGEEWFWTQEELAWVTFTKIYHESYWFSLDVHNGELRGDRGKSVCLGQIMRGEEELVGTDMESTRRCLKRVIAYLVMHQNGCLAKQAKPSSWSVARIYAGYGTGRTCDARHWMWKTNAKGEKVKHYWALERGSRYWQMRNGRYPAQKVKMSVDEFRPYQTGN
jgi:hypothetical protein